MYGGFQCLLLFQIFLICSKQSVQILRLCIGSKSKVMYFIFYYISYSTFYSQLFSLYTAHCEPATWPVKSSSEFCVEYSILIDTGIYVAADDLSDHVFPIGMFQLKSYHNRCLLSSP